jgi:hypothetical protein
MLIRKYFVNYFEVVVWITALLLLAFMSPTDAHASLCPFSASGITFCPGCGLGHSISWLFRGNVDESFHAHPLGWLAVLILTWRIFTLIRKPII